MLRADRSESPGGQTGGGTITEDSGGGGGSGWRGDLSVGCDRGEIPTLDLILNSTESYEHTSMKRSIRCGEHFPSSG